MKIILIAASLMMAGHCLAQAPVIPPEQHYKFDFAVKEFDAGKLVSTRVYSSQSSANGDKLYIRTGDRIQVPSGPAGSTSFTYLDVGTNIDCSNLLVEQGGVRFTISADVSTLVNPQVDKSFLQNKWSARVVVPFRKPTTLFSSDAISSKHQIQIEVTVTPIQ